MKRVLFFAYGVVAYVVFLVSFLYAIGFTGNFLVPKSIDTGVNTAVWPALLINALLLGLFAVQHSIMARPWFKNVWTKIVPKPIERSTFVLLASLILLLMYWKWQPITTVVWQVENPTMVLLLQAIFWIGWLTVLTATFMIDHFDLFGLRQVTLYLQKKVYTYPNMARKMLYRRMRHPIMAGFIIAFWATPDMTVGHLLFTVLSTGYILVGIYFEERDLVRFHGKDYLAYREEVRMLIPFPRKRTRSAMPDGMPEGSTESTN